jgi:two-component SAPR family response regulator
MPATVLIAEDELIIAMDVIDELDAAGFVTIGPFAKTSQALDYCRAHTPDCAVLDVRLADGESFPLADLLTERNVPIVFHSGHAARSALSERYPKMRVCPKPARSSQLAATVAEACAPSHASA